MRDNYLIVVQELKVAHVPINISIIEDQLEQQNIAVSNKLFNNVRYLAGIIGAGLAKKSITTSGMGTVYFVDPNNGYPCRDGYDGLKVINTKMSKYFIKKLKNADPSNIVGYYNDQNQEWNLSFEDETIVWSEKNNRWTSFRDYKPEKGFSMFTDMFTYINGSLYIHKESDIRNNFYGEQYQTSIDFPIGAISIKNYHSLAIHSNTLLVTKTDGITTSLGHVSDLIKSDFVNREGIWYANFLRDKNTDLINGSRLKGRYINLKLITINGTEPLQLFKIVIKSNISTTNE